MAKQETEGSLLFDYVHQQLLLNSKTKLIHEESFSRMLMGLSPPIWILDSSTIEEQSLSNDVYKMESMRDDLPHFANH